MRDLTDYATFAPIEAIRALEVDAFVQRQVGGVDQSTQMSWSSRGPPRVRITVWSVPIC